jgi:tetratricopeptide (TPR) repeat protein
MSLKNEGDLSPAGRNQLSRAKAAIQAKNTDYAITLLQSILKEEPLFLDGRKLLRYIEIQKYKAQGSFARQMAGMRLSGGLMKIGSNKKTPEEQLIQAEEILVQDPFNHKANAQLGDAGMVLGYPEFKCFAYEILRESKPGDKTILTQLAEAYMAAGEPAKAEKIYEQILEVDPKDGDALSGFKNASAAHASKTGGWETSGGDYRKVIKDIDQAKELEQQSKAVKSEEGIEELIAANFEKHQAQPTNPNHSKAIAALFLQKGDLPSSIQWYEHAFEAGGRTDSSLEKVIGDLKLKTTEQELQALREQLAALTIPEEKMHMQGLVDGKERELNEVRLAMAEARVKSQPNEGEFRYDLGEALFKVGQYKRAVEELQHSLKQPAVRYQALNLMGQAFMKRGMHDFAIKQLMTAEGELPVMDALKKEIVYNLGLVYEVTKQPEKALEQWKKIYEVDMGYRDVAARVEASYGEQG